MTKDRHTIEPEMIIYNSHHGGSPPFACLAEKSITTSQRFSTDSFGEPTNEETKTRTAHTNRVFFVQKTLGKFIIVDMYRKEQSRQMVQRVRV
jgi:hypothetical protein